MSSSAGSFHSTSLPFIGVSDHDIDDPARCSVSVASASLVNFTGCKYISGVKRDPRNGRRLILSLTPIGLLKGDCWKVLARD